MPEAYTLLGMVIFSIFPVYAITYNPVPIMFLLASVFYSLHINRASLVVSGILITMAFVSKISFLIFIPPLIFGVFVTNYSGLKLGLKHVLWLILGMFVGALVVTFVYQSLNFEGSIFDLSQKINDEHFKSAGKKELATSHGLFKILETYWFDLKYIWKKMYMVLCALPILLVLGVKDSNKNWRLLFSILLLTFGLYFVANTFYYWQGMLAFMVPFVLLSFLGFIKKRKAWHLYYWSTVIFVLSFFGSNNGLTNIFYTGGVILAVPTTIISLESINWKFKKWQFSYKYVSYALIMAFLYLGISWHQRKVYRDLDRTQLYTPFKSHNLVGIYSSQDKVTEIDNYLNYINKNLTTNDSILAVNTIPMLSFLSDKTANVNISCCGWLGVNLSELKYQYILLNEKDSRESLWPNSTKPCHKGEIEKFDEYYNYLNKHYILTYSGKALHLYKKRH
jgi:hypothetical protein